MLSYRYLEHECLHQVMQHRRIRHLSVGPTPKDLVASNAVRLQVPTNSSSHHRGPDSWRDHVGASREAAMGIVAFSRRRPRFTWSQMENCSCLYRARNRLQDKKTSRLGSCAWRSDGIDATTTAKRNQYTLRPRRSIYSRSASDDPC